MALIYCDSLATGANNGTSWVNAYTSLQAAVDAASTSDTIYTNAPESAPLRPASRAVSGITIITDEGQSQHTWISNGYALSWTDVGGGVFSASLATKPVRVAYDFKRDDETGTVTGVNLNDAKFGGYVDRAIEAFPGISRSDLVAWYGFLVENTSTPTTPGDGEWGHSSGTLYVNPPGSPTLATVNDRTQYCPDTIDAINLNGNSNTVTCTSPYGLTTILTPGVASNGGYSVKMGGTNGVIRGVRGIANGWHCCGHAIASNTSGSRMERCINITHAAGGDSDIANPFVFFSANNGSNYVADRMISILVPLLRHDGHPLQSTFLGTFGLSHTSVLGATISNVSWRRCHSIDMTSLVATKHSVSVGGIGSFIVANNAPAPSQASPSSWSHIAEDCYGSGRSAVPRSRIMHRRCRLDRMALGSNSDNIAAMTVAGNDYYRIEDSILWPGRNSHGLWNSGSSTNGWAEVVRSLIFIERSTATSPRPSIMQGHNVPFRIESSALGTIAAAGVVGHSNQPSSTTGPLITSNSRNIFGAGMSGSYQDHSNTGVAAKDWAYWRDGTDGKVTGGSGDLDSRSIAITTSLTNLTPLRDGDTLEFTNGQSMYVAFIGRTAGSVTVEVIGGVMSPSSEFTDRIPKAMTPGQVAVLSVEMLGAGTITVTGGDDIPVELTATAQEQHIMMQAMLETRGGDLKVLWKTLVSQLTGSQVAAPTYQILSNNTVLASGSLTWTGSEFRAETLSATLPVRQNYTLRCTASIGGNSVTREQLITPRY
jgi:hypothetical protein